MGKTADRVKVTTTTTGTGTYTIIDTAAPGGFRTFAQAIAAAAFVSGELVEYVVYNGTDFEAGEGVYTSGGTSLTRATIRASSNSGAAVSWAAGTKDVWLNAPAAYSFGGIPLAVVVASGAATVDLPFDSTFDNYIIRCTDIQVATNGADVQLQLKLAGTIRGSDYAWSMTNLSPGGGFSGSALSGQSAMTLLPAKSNSGAFRSYVTLEFGNVAAAKPPIIDWHGAGWDSVGPLFRVNVGSGMNDAFNGPITLARFQASSGNLSMVARLYGIPNS